MKEIFNWMQVIAVLVTWCRFFSFFLVIRQVSILILTLIQMVVKSMSFVMMTMAYIILMIPIF